MTENSFEKKQNLILSKMVDYAFSNSRNLLKMTRINVKPNYERINDWSVDLALIDRILTTIESILLYPQYLESSKISINMLSQSLINLSEIVELMRTHCEITPTEQEERIKQNTEN